MSLGTIYPNLYKGNAKDTKTPMNSLLLVFSFLVFASVLVSGVFAAHASMVLVSDGADRINKTGTANSVVWQFNVTNQAGSAATVTMINITNATGYVVTSVNATGNSTQACTINQLSVNCTGLNVAAGGKLIVNVTTTEPSASGIGTWTLYTQDSANAVVTNTLYTAAIDGADLAFDIYDEVGNVTTGVQVTLINGSQVKFVQPGSNAVFTDSAGTGIIEIESGNVSSQQADTVQFNVTRDGFVSRNSTTTRNDGTTTSYDPNSGNAGWNNGFRATGLLYNLKITVTDQFGTALRDAVVNITAINKTDGSGVPINSTSTSNVTAANVQYFALPNATLNGNVTISVARSGFLTNGSNTLSSTWFLVNSSAQQTGNSTYRMFYVLKVNVTDELGAGGVFADNSTTKLSVNDTLSTANATDPVNPNVYFYSIGYTAAKINVSKAGYVNITQDNIPLNTTTQASINPQLLFPLKITLQDELGAGTAGMGSGVGFSLNGTPSSANSTSSNVYYFNLSTPGNINITASHNGYINTSSNSWPLNATTQAAATVQLPFSIKVATLCNEIGTPGNCYTMDGSESSVEVSGNGNRNTTYNGGIAYINASNNPAQGVIINASKDGYVNSTSTIITNQSTQAVWVFNSSNTTAPGLQYAIKVLGVFDELGTRNFTLNITDAAINVTGKTNVVTYFGTNAYVNATGTSEVSLVAKLVNQSLVNTTQNITPSASSQKTVLFNTTNGLSATVLASGLRYIIKITVQDELGNALTSNTIALNGTDTTPDATSSNVYYFANQSSSGVLLNKTSGGVNTSVSRAGYINTTNNSQSVTNASQLSMTIQLPFNIKILAKDELNTNFTASAVTFYANGTVSNTVNTTSGRFAYFALPLASGSGTANISASSSGYIDNSTAIVFPINQSAQAVQNITMLFTIQIPIRGICDEINVTCLTIDGSTATIGSGGVEASSVSRGATNATTYSGGTAYINATNGTSITIKAFGSGYVNTTATATPNSGNQTLVVFNTSSSLLSQVNASALPFTLKIISVCDELNKTCVTINGSSDRSAYGGAQLAGNTTRYSGVFGYIAAPGTGALSITAFGKSYVNATNASVTPTPGTAQVTITFNASTTPLKYTAKITLQDDLGTSTGMDSGVTVNVNGTAGTENKDFFRTASTSNIYYINATVNASGELGVANISFKKDGYIYQNSTGVSINGSTQMTNTSTLPFAVKITTKDQSGNVYSGATVQLLDANSNTWSVDDGNATVSTIINSASGTNTSGSVGDLNSTGGYIYWPINQSNITNNLYATVYPNANGYSIWGPFSGYQINYTTQLSLTSANVRNTIAPAAATSVTATASGKQVSITWTASTSNDVSYYRVYRNNTLIGTASTTSFTDNPTTGDTTAPGAPSSVTAVALSSGGQINVSWTAPSNSIYAYNVTAVDTGNNVALTNGSSSAVTISPVASYRVFRNTTQLLGSTTTTTYTDSPIAGVYFYNVTTVSDASVLSSTNGSSSTVDSRDVTAPAAASSVTATIVTNNATSRQVQVTWTASTSSDASYYRVYRNNTLLGTSSTTTYTDYPNAGIFVYNITTVDTTGNLATSNGTATAVTLGELVGPTINITSPQSGVNVTSASPTISFTVLDNDGGSGVAVTTIAVNITGFNATRDCTRNNDLNYTCTFSTSGLTDLANSTITISAKDAFNNAATNATRNFGVNTLNGVTATLNTSDTSAIADNTYANGWSFTFNVTLGSTTTNSTNVNATSVKVGNWTQVGGTGTIVTVGNTIMNYTDASGTARTAYISDRYNTTDTIYPLQDLDTTTSAINGTVTIYVKLPTSTTPGTYTTTFTFGSYNVSLSTGGNPS